MPWHLTGDISVFVTAADDYLRGDPVLNTVPLSVLAGLLASGPAAYGDDPPQFGWHESGGRTDGAVLRTPPHPLLVAGFPAGSAAGLLSQLARTARPGRALPDAGSLLGRDADEFSAAWARRHRRSARRCTTRCALFRLAACGRPARPRPERPARPAAADFDLLCRWYRRVRRGDRRRRRGPGQGGPRVPELRRPPALGRRGPAAMAVLSRTRRRASAGSAPSTRRRTGASAATAAPSPPRQPAGAGCGRGRGRPLHRPGQPDQQRAVRAAGLPADRGPGHAGPASSRRPRALCGPQVFGLTRSRRLVASRPGTRIRS